MNESTLTKALKAIATHETVDGYDCTKNGDDIGAVCYDAYYVIHGLKAQVKELKKELETARVESLKEFAKRLNNSFYHRYPNRENDILEWKVNRAVQKILDEMLGEYNDK